MRLFLLKSFCFSLLITQITFAATIEERLRPPLVAAHRGGMVGLSSNTLEQFKNAMAGPTEIIEMDLRLSRDGIVVVYHDPSLDSNTNCTGPVEDKTFAELSNCKLKRTGFKIPSFAQVLELVQGKKIVDAELKTDDVALPAVRLIQQYHAHEWAYFQTKSDADVYRQARNADPRVALLFKPNTDTELDWALSLNDPRLIVIEFDEDLMNNENLRKVRAHGKLIRANAWTFDAKKEILKAACTKLYKWGVSIAHTNRPDTCAKQKKSYREP